MLVAGNGFAVPFVEIHLQGLSHFDRRHHAALAISIQVGGDTATELVKLSRLRYNIKQRLSLCHALGGSTVSRPLAHVGRQEISEFFGICTGIASGHDGVVLLLFARIGHGLNLLLHKGELGCKYRLTTSQVSEVVECDLTV